MTYNHYFLELYLYITDFQLFYQHQYFLRFIIHLELNFGYNFNSYQFNHLNFKKNFFH